MKGFWKTPNKHSKKSRNNKPWWKPIGWWKKEQRQKRRAKERQALQKGQEEMPKVGKDWWL